MHAPVPATVGDREVAVGAVGIAVVSAGICLASDNLAFMSLLVPIVVLARFAARRVLRLDVRHPWRDGWLVLACTVVGGFNDWNTVVRHGVYRYSVPHAWPEVSTIPLWMLLYWGLILRFLLTIFRWDRISFTGDRVAYPRPRLRVAVELFLVLATRQAIFRWHDDPVWSWVPFAVALAVYIGLFGLGRAERIVVVLMGVAGPLVEGLYIGVGGLHKYDLGILFGVPAWIILWWILAALVLRDLSLRAWALADRSRPEASSRPETGTCSPGADRTSL